MGSWKSVLRVALSIVAVILGGLGTAGIAAGPVSVSPMLAGLALAAAEVFAWAGYQPIVVPPPVAKLCVVMGTALSVFVVQHVAMLPSGSPASLGMIAVGWVAVCLGALGRGVVAPPPALSK